MYRLSHLQHILLLYITLVSVTQYVCINLSELCHLCLVEWRFADDGGIIRGVQRGSKLVASQHLLHDLLITACTLWAHVIEEGAYCRGGET